MWFQHFKFYFPRVSTNNVITFAPHIQNFYSHGEGIFLDKT